MEGTSAQVRYPCCGKSDHSVFFGGDVKGYRYTVFDDWLRTVSPVDFVHIVKKPQNGYGHVHFATHDEASRFYCFTLENKIVGPDGSYVKFKASHFISGEKVEYERVGSFGEMFGKWINGISNISDALPLAD
ncbi:hypothetical protein BC936DRAFT_144907 [Jimgerdemannia flammicorona]|uniref:Uncharacterized protein n=2 Tax=Jimgerdemannia flammicorona TaxID=994334 RepID=A0A433QRJ0_9FUNG|nr:hypothetical protein BC936DRAFT_144907 [Jimgerdemannia flammicorona]RUS32367.1 hypothetical protein BC938DRAFT_475602 [Jimgerdemannia flammicorona]